MRLKMCSNTSEGEDSQQPITSNYCEGQHLTDFFPAALAYIAILAFGLEWEQENQIVVPIPRQSVPVAPRNLKTLIIYPSELL